MYASHDVHLLCDHPSIRTARRLVQRPGVLDERLQLAVPFPARVHLSAVDDPDLRPGRSEWHDDRELDLPALRAVDRPRDLGHRVLRGAQADLVLPRDVARGAIRPTVARSRAQAPWNVSAPSRRLPSKRSDIAAPTV